MFRIHWKGHSESFIILVLTLVETNWGLCYDNWSYDVVKGDDDTII